MRSRKIILVISIALLSLLTTAVALYRRNIPRLVQIYPTETDGNVPAGTSLKLVFSNPVDPESIQTHLSTEPAMAGVFDVEGANVTFTPDGPWESGGTVTVTLETGFRSAIWPRLPTFQDQVWSFHISRPLLAYLYPSDGLAELYTVDLQNGDVRQLTDSPGGVIDFTVNTAGTRIYYSTDQGGGGTTIYELDRAALESKVLLRCTQALCRYLEVSPDERFLAYEQTMLGNPGQTNTPQVMLLPLEQNEGSGKEKRGQPYPAADPTHRTQQPLWSPTGLLSYYDHDRAAFVVDDVEKGEAIHFPSQTGIPGAWHPSGQYYIFPEIYSNEIASPELSAELGAISSSHLLQYSLDGTFKDLTGVDEVEDASPAFSPDGGYLAFGRKYLDTISWTPGRQLWIMDTNNQESLAITDEPEENHYDFAWSPDGSLLAFARFNKNQLTAPPEVWLINTEGTYRNQIVSGGYAPSWIP
jgi:WD40 repeat protein